MYLNQLNTYLNPRFRASSAVTIPISWVLWIHNRLLVSKSSTSSSRSLNLDANSWISSSRPNGKSWTEYQTGTITSQFFKGRNLPVPLPQVVRKQRASARPTPSRKTPSFFHAPQTTKRTASKRRYRGRGCKYPWYGSKFSWFQQTILQIIRSIKWRTQNHRKDANTSNVFGSKWNVNVQQFLDGQTVALFVAHHRYVVEPIEIR